MDSKKISDIAFSVLDLAAVTEGHTPTDAFRNSLDLAKHAEKSGYTRYWFAEHHNMVSVASSAPTILIGYIAGNTTSIRVGSGGVMLPNHAPLIVAEQFGTLASLYPGRIDLGLGRAPGSDQITAYAIRGENMNASYHFPQDVELLQTLFSDENVDGQIRANPGEGLDIPIWILGSSTDSAMLAAKMGLPYAFASHFAPAMFLKAISLYRQNFRPSAHLKVPYVMACVNVVAADNDAEAERLATSLKKMFLGVITGKRNLLSPPVEDLDKIWNIYEKEAVLQMLSYSFVGGPEKIKKEMEDFIAKTQIDEVMVTANIYDHQARLHSYELFADVLKSSNMVLS